MAKRLAPVDSTASLSPFLEEEHEPDDDQAHIRPYVDEDLEPLPHSESIHADKILRWKRIGFRAVFNFCSVTFLAVLISCSFYFYLNGIGIDDGGADPISEFRLPTYIVPTHYDLYLKVDLQKWRFSGEVEIELDINATGLAFPWSNRIIIHALDLQISTVMLQEIQGLQVVQKPKTMLFVKEDQILELSFPNRLKTEKYRLVIEFSGLIQDDLRGFYRSSYKDSAGQVHWLASTQFEATDARKVFPCFDEPSFKASFSLSIEVDSAMNVISNMPIKEVDAISATKKVVSFEPTPHMSTYLLAFVVSELECLTTKMEGRDTEIFVCAQPEQLATGNYALEITPKILRFYETFFQLEYPLPKLHLVAIPDFCCGAMENWGLITFRETALLFNQSVGGAFSQQRVATVIAHELAHQWFGNLVTMEWWDDLWLNEGFASFMEYLGVDSIEPTWAMKFEQLFLLDTSDEMIEDALLTTHTITANVTQTAMISQLFDSISYSKGASILRMLQAYMNYQSPSLFETRIQVYLAENSYKNTKTEDLWKYLETGSISVKNLMRSWTNQPGFPLVNIAELEGGLKLSQERFLSFPSQLNSTIKSQKWMIPLAIISSTNQTSHVVLEEHSTSITFQKQKWYKVNYGQSVPCRFLYPRSNLFNIQSALIANLHALPAIDRAGLIDDVWSLSYSGFISSVDVMNYSRFLDKETHAVVWEVALNKMTSVADLLAENSLLGKIASFFLSLMDSSLNSFESWTNSVPEDHLGKLLQTVIIKAAIQFGDQRTLQKGYEAFKSLQNGEQISIPADSLSLVYFAGVKLGNESDFQFVKQAYLNSNFATEKQILLQALSFVQSHELLEEVVSMSLSEDVRSQDSTRLITYVSQNPLGKSLAWNYIQSNWETLFERYGEGGFYLSSLISNVVGSLSTPTHQKEAQSFFQNHLEPSISASVESALERIAANRRWVEEEAPLLEAWFAKNP